jgi:hypothetical protein
VYSHIHATAMQRHDKVAEKSGSVCIARVFEAVDALASSHRV